MATEVDLDEVDFDEVDLEEVDAVRADLLEVNVVFFAVSSSEPQVKGGKSNWHGKGKKVHTQNNAHESVYLCMVGPT